MDIQSTKYSENIPYPMKNEHFADRLNLALDKEGFPPKNRGRIQLLAEMMGLTHRGASKWINGETCPPYKKFPDIAKKLNVNENWLRTGSGVMHDKPNILLNDSDIVKIPVYKTEDTLSNSKIPIEYVSCNLTLTSNENLFAIKLDSEAMFPRFPSGSIIIFDGNKAVKDGDFILVKCEDYPAPIFRQILIIGSSCYLNAHNPKFERLTLPNKNSILGVMVQAILSFT